MVAVAVERLVDTTVEVTTLVSVEYKVVEEILSTKVSFFPNIPLAPKVFIGPQRYLHSNRITRHSSISSNMRLNQRRNRRTDIRLGTITRHRRGREAQTRRHGRGGFRRSLIACFREAGG